MRVLLWATASRPAITARLKKIEGLDLVSVDNEQAVIDALPDAEVLALQVFYYTPAVAAAVRETATKLVDPDITGSATTGWPARASRLTSPSRRRRRQPWHRGRRAYADLDAGAAAPRARGAGDAGQWAMGRGVMGRMTSLRQQESSRSSVSATGREIGRLLKVFCLNTSRLAQRAAPHPSADEVMPVTRLGEALACADIAVKPAGSAAHSKRRADVRCGTICADETGAFFINIARGPVVDTTVGGRTGRAASSPVLALM